MRGRRLARGVVVAAGLAVALPLPWSLQGREPQTTQPPATIPSASEPGEALAIDQRSRRTGLVSFAASRGNGILVSVQPNALAETRARSFIGLYGAAFGIRDNSQVTLRRAERDRLGLEHVRFQQTHRGVPVTAGELVVHLRGSRVMAANGRILDDLPADVAPAIGPDAAIAAAAEAVGRYHPARAGDATYETPRLEVFNRGMLEDGAGLSRLAWFVEARGPALREYLWIDAATGGVLLNFSQIASAKSRQTYDGHDTFTLPGTLVRSEGAGAVGDPDVDGAHDFAGSAYDYFFFNFGRDSYDGAGATIVSTVDHCPNGGPCPLPNAFWNGGQMVFGDGWAAADDLVGHELAHGVIEQTADLFYYAQSGALNESYADIFGESNDMLNGLGDDSSDVRWLFGEELPGGAIRYLKHPSMFGDPDQMSGPEFFCIEDGWTNPVGDDGGVHTNSGVPNHSYAHMVDGGEYQGRTLNGIGLAKGAAIHYRALTTYLTSGATFAEHATALVQACADLLGGPEGITAADCTQVRSVVEASEMRQTWPCAGATPPPPACPTGAAPSSTLFGDDFESGGGNPDWDLSAGWFASSSFVAGGGSLAVFAPDGSGATTRMLRQNASIGPLPANARLYFDHAFEFQNAGGTAFDGGVIEYSTDAGATWQDAGALIDGGQTYNGTIGADHGNPLGGRAAFAFTSYGFSASRLDLSSLAGQSVRFRFLLGQDDAVGSLGWYVDNLQIYSCADPDAGMVANGTFDEGQTNGLPDGWMKFSLPAPSDIVVDNAGGRLNFQRPAGSEQAVVFQQTGIPVPAWSPLSLSFQVGSTDTVRKRISVLLHDADFSDLAVCTFWLDPGNPLQTFSMQAHTTEPWTNATVSFYAASTGPGAYQLDNVTLEPQPDEWIYRTDCVDPNAPAAGGTTSADLIVNGDFSGGLAPWSAFGNLAWQVTGGIFEFFKLEGDPAGVVLQGTGAPMAQDQRMLLTLRLGNRSGVRQRVTVLLHHQGFEDLHACTFYLSPGQLPSTYAVRTYATIPWANATVSVYPATVGTSPSAEWLQLDTVSLTRVTETSLGTECLEPGAAPAF